MVAIAERGLHALLDLVLAPEPQSMWRALDHIHRNYGDMQDYLLKLGLDETAPELSKSRLSEDWKTAECPTPIRTAPRALAACRRRY